MMRAPHVIGLTLGAVLAVSSLGVWTDGAHAGPRANAPAHGRFQEGLGLTDDQMAQVRAIHERYADQRRDVGKALAQAQRDLRALALNSGDAAAVKAKSAEVTALIGQAVDLRTASLQEMSPLLTPEQREKLAQMSEDHFHHRPPPPGGPRRP